jgi:hypothetical protein
MLEVMMPGVVSRRGFAAMFALLAFLALSGRAYLDARQTPLPSGREIAARHVAALGGVAAYKAIASVHARGRFEIRDRGITGEFELFTARPNRMLYRVTVPGIGVIENGFNGQVGWSLNPISGPELLDGQQLVEAADDAWFDSPLYEDDHVRSLSTLERTEFDGRAAFKVRVVLRSGGTPVEYFDASTGLQIGSESVRATPQGPVPTLNILRDHRRFGAVLQATSFVQRALGFEQVVTIASCEYDTVPDGTFAVPPSIAALVRR